MYFRRIMSGRKCLPLICGMLLGALAVHFVHLGTRQSPPRLTERDAAQKVPDTVKAATAEHGPRGAAQVLCPTVKTVASKLPASQQLRDIPEKLYKRVRILCLIMTHPANYGTKAVAVNNTWARRCNRHVFVGSTDASISIPLIRLKISESRDNLWQKTWMSLEHVYREFSLSEVDFVLKADDDTFVVMENLRLLLLPLDPNQPSIIGRRFKYDGDADKPYMSGGAGYVLSRQALKLLVQHAIIGGKDPCHRHLKFSEDFMLGNCLRHMGVKFIDSRDSRGLDRFHPLSANYMIGWGPVPMPKWMETFNYFPFKACVENCISSLSVTFHYVQLLEMYRMEFLLYGMRPMGIDPTVIETGITELLKSL